jgi:N-acetylglucosamine kinase-like BadF-type ATPase
MNISTATISEDLPAHAYYLGVDGGGSKTLAVIVNAQGEEVGRGLAGSSNYTAIGLEQAVQNIFSSVTQALQPLGKQIHPHRAWLGLAGFDRPIDSVQLSSHLQELASLVHITNDAELAFSVLPDAIGVVLIAGTGSISLGRNIQGQATRAGGWGHLLGDEGSGYFLGHQALLAAVRAADGRGPHTCLLDLILQHWQLHTSDDIIGAVYNTTEEKAKIAQLADCVIQAQIAGDTIAHAIVQNAVNELVLTVKTVRQKLGLASDQPIPLAISGGLLLHQPHFRIQVLEQLHSQLTISDVVQVEQPALSAAQTMITTENFNIWTHI